MKYKILPLIIFCFLLLSSLIFNQHSKELERGYYTATFLSVVENKDLNIINHVTNQEKWMLTKNFNHPTHISRGVVMFWFPFFYYSKLVTDLKVQSMPIVGKFDYLKFAELIANSFYLTMGIVVLFYCYYRSRDNLYKKIDTSYFWYSFLIVFAATPLLCNIILTPFNTEIVLFFLGSLWIFLMEDYVKNLENSKLTSSFFLGLFLGLGVVTKVSFFPYAIATFLYMLCQQTKLKKLWTKILCGTVGFLFVLSLMFINNFIQFGEWVFFPHQLAVSEISSSFSWELFKIFYFTGDNSIFYASPIIGFLFLLTAFLLIKERKSETGWIKIPVVLFFIIFIFSFKSNLTYPDLIASRLFIVLLPVFVLSLEKLWELKNRWGKLFVLSFIVWSFLVNSIHVLMYLEDIKTISKFNIQIVLEHFLAKVKINLESLLNTGVNFDLLKFLPLVFLIFSVLLVISDYGKLKKITNYILCFCGVGYFLITILNYSNNERNVKKFEQAGVFASSVVAKTYKLALYDEIVSMYELGEENFPSLLSTLTSKRKNQYQNEIVEDILIDNFGLKKKIQNKEYPKSIWNQ